MRFIRCLLMLLAINLPGFGGAFAAAPACPMQHGPAAGVAAQRDGAMAVGAGAMAEHGALPARGEHCCADSSGTKVPDHSCPDGMQCQCGAFYCQAAQPVSAPVLPASPGSGRAADFHVITASAMPLWRPPTLS